MSQENVELNYRSHDAFNRRDLDAYLALNDPDVEFTPYERVIEGLGPYYGHDGVRTWWKEAFATLPDVGAGARLRGRGAASGASFERTYWGLFRWRDKRTVWWHAFQSEAEALEAARLRE
jgi:SnoaL-like domain